MSEQHENFNEYKAPEPHFGYPSGPQLNTQIKRRKRGGQIWYVLLMGSLIISILALIALLYTIVNDAFGLTAVEYQNDPVRLVLEKQEDILLADDDTFNSEDDSVLAAKVAEDPNAIGFFGYAYYQENRDALKLLSVAGVEPNAETVENGRYPLARPLYLYSDADILQENQAANVFLNYYLTNVNNEIDDVGYFALSPGAMAASQQTWIAANEMELKPGQWAAINPDGVGGSLTVASSSTVFPLTERMNERIQESGFVGTLTNESMGTTAGYRAFCVEDTADIAAGSRPMNQNEFAACRGLGKRPLPFQVGTDALAVVVNPANNFLSDVTSEQLSQIFTTAKTWADVNPDWLNEPIHKYVPGTESGTLDFFVESSFPQEMGALATPYLVEILAENVSAGLGRRLESEQRFFDDSLVFFTEAQWQEACNGTTPYAGCTLDARSKDNILLLIEENVTQPNVVAAWKLMDSLFGRAEIEQEVLLKYPAAEVQWYSWINWDFITQPQSSVPELAGVRTAILGSLLVIAITAFISFPIGVGAAIYLEEYATDNRLNRILQTNISNLAGVPSIIYGMLGLAVFVRAMEGLTSGAMFGAVAAGSSGNGRTVLAAGLTLTLLVLPIIIISAQEALRSVPSSMRQGGLALGATKWQTIWAHVLPNAMPGILTGAILSISRALGETAPLVVIGASTFITTDPTSPFSKFTTLPVQIYQWTSRPQAEFQNLAAAAIVVLLILLLILNATAVYLRNRFARRTA
ncbi:MAG: phosphate ABC transporter permease PstA [Anaerolineae bacterium]|nr:phosphate ABC transporter permease PstA [Anaerolineae bacterium]